MAGIAYVRKRLWNPELLIDPTGLIPNRLVQDVNRKHQHIYEITWKGDTQSGEELGTAATSVKDGTTTPFQVTVVSSHADDTNATDKDVRAVALIGITTNSIAGYQAWNDSGLSTREGRDGVPLSTVEVILMNGTSNVLSTRFYIWNDAIYSVNWGSGGQDAAGNITAESPANTNLLVLLAGNNEGEGGVWHFPPNHNVTTQHIHITPTEVFAATTGIVLQSEFTAFEQATNTDPDLDIDYYQYTTPSLDAEYTREQTARRTTIKSQCLWKETSVFASKAVFLNIVQEFH
jgi:hypothetical protein